MKIKILSILFFITSVVTAQSIGNRPKIGLALSGGGAKGLAHIGILKAIDSAGLQIDYITGTSMGAIVGSLYAVGYTGEQIEKIARTMDWDLMLSNQLSLRSLSMEEKEEYGKYAIELPYIKNKLQLPVGVFEGQEIWLKFADLFYPVHNIKDFSKFSIPFKCIASDIVTGKAVVIDSGEITSAIRASMAIPSFFTTVDYNGHKLVDGGLVRNFPVTDVIEMGADVVIGSSVTSGLNSKEKLNSAIDIILQLAFFKEAEDYSKEVPLCNIFIGQPLDGFSMGSFGDAEDILDKGLQTGRSFYPAFKHLADSLNGIFGVKAVPENRLPKVDSVFISAFEIRGLHKTSADFFIHAMDFDDNRSYSQEGISNLVRRVFGTRYYSSINYRIEALANGTSKIIFSVNENPSTLAKIGLHYNDFSGISLIANITSRDYFTRNSRSLATINIGENFRLRGEHLQYFGIKKNLAIIPQVSMESIKINTFQNFKRTGQYRQIYTNTELKAQLSGYRRMTIGFGTRYEFIRFKPLIQTALEARGKNDFLTTFGYIEVNTLNKTLYPTRGLKLSGEYGFVFNQRPDIDFTSNGIPITNIDSLGIDYRNYQRLAFSAEGYIPVTKRLTITPLLQGGVNFNYKQGLVNNFLVGGLTRTFRNQIIFAGLDETTINTSSVATFMFGVRYQPAKNIYIMARSNAMVYDFINQNQKYSFENWLTGHAITLAYTTPIGPLEFSVHYSDQSQRVLTYVNFGISF